MIVEIRHNDEVIESLDLGEGSYKIGRSSECEIRIKSVSVSKEHALLVIKDNKAAIIDLGSSNGVFVNGVLIKKQRLHPGDDVMISEFHLSIGKRKRQSAESSHHNQNADMGNLAMDLNFENQPMGAAEESSEPTPQEKLLRIMDEKVLTPFYSLIRSVDWRILIGGMVLFVSAVSILACVVFFLRWGTEIATQQALDRGHAILRQVVRENTRILRETSNYSKLTIAAAEREPGILAASILDPRSQTILAPAKYFNNVIENKFDKLAIERILNGEDRVEEDAGGGVQIIAQPIFLTPDEVTDRMPTAIVIADFRIPDEVYAIYNPLVSAILLSFLSAIVAFYLISMVFTYPVVKMHEQLDDALKGENVNITSEAKSDELEKLATAINFSVSRWKQMEGGPGGGDFGMGGDDQEAEDQRYIDTVREFDQGSTDGLLLLDKDKKVSYVGAILEELIGLRNQYAIGQNISEACRDQSFAGTCIDLVENVIQTLGETQEAELDINGISRQITAVAHRNSSSGDITFVFILVKMNEQPQ